MRGFYKVEIKTGFAQLSNVDMYYEVCGEGEPILLIHGIDSDSRLWDRTFAALGNHYKTIRFDLRGFGNTAMPKGEFQLLDDIHDLLVELDVESAHIVGYSYGGTVAPSFALKYPEMVKSLTLVGAGMIGHQWSEEVSDYYKKFQETIGNQEIKEMMRLLKWKSVYGPKRKEEGLDDVCNQLEEMFLHALSKPREGTPLPICDKRNELSQIPSPTYILVGELDFPDYHDIANFYNEKIPNSRKEIFPQAGHLLILENPTLFNEKVLGFLGSIEETARVGN